MIFIFHQLHYHKNNIYHQILLQKKKKSKFAATIIMKQA